MAGHDLVFFLNAFIRVQSVKIRGLIIWLRLCRAVSIRGLVLFATACFAGMTTFMVCELFINEI